MSSPTRSNRTAYDKVIRDIADYVHGYRIRGERAWQAAHHCLVDSLGCAFEARGYPDCSQLLGASTPGTTVANGARVPGTPFELGVVEAAFNTSTLIRWLDYNDAFYGETVIHPSDCLGGLLAAADWRSRALVAQGKPPLTVRDVLDAMIRAYEVMGCLALANGFTTRMSMDHVVLIKVGCAAAVTRLLGGTREEIMHAVSNAWIDGQTLALFRRGREAGARKSWAAGDAAARGTWLALMTLRGESGYAAALTAKTWGFYAVHNKGRAFRFQRPYGTYVIENVQYKISYPAGIHAQTAAEAAIRLHPGLSGRLDDIRRVDIWTHRYALAILDKTGPLRNFAERDHCMQYIAAIGMIFGRLESTDYEETVASDPRIDALRRKILLHEHAPYTRGFFDPARRSNANAMQVTFRDGSRTARVEVEYAVGHPRRRKEGLPLLERKFENNVARVYAGTQRRRIMALCDDRRRLAETPVNELFDLLATP